MCANVPMIGSSSLNGAPVAASATCNLRAHRLPHAHDLPARLPLRSAQPIDDHARRVRAIAQRLTRAVGGEVASALLRTLLLITAAIFAAFGAVLFVAPTWAAPRFPFEASPFAVMTAGSWFLGGAFLAWWSVRDARWAVVYPGIIYVAALPILETGVLIAPATRWRARW